jgi:hypothetical protein
MAQDAFGHRPITAFIRTVDGCRAVLLAVTSGL